MKKIMFITLILLLFITCSGVWAADNITDEIIADSDDCINLQSSPENDFDQSDEVLKANDSNVEGEYVDASEAYEYLNAFRTEENVWYWNADDVTQSNVNTNDTVWLKPLKRDIELENTAKIRAKEISEYFSHARPDGSMFFSIFPENLLDYGENIAEGYVDSFDVTEGWKETDMSYDGQGHRRNMLIASYNYVGIAGYKINGTIYWVQNFGCRYDPEDVGNSFAIENNTLNPKFTLTLPKYASGSFDVYVNGTLMNSKSLSNGRAEIPICGLSGGAYEIFLSYSGDYNCRPFNQSETIVIPDHENSKDTLTFNHLNTVIKMAGDEIKLENDYVFTSDTDSSLTQGIEINKMLTIDGQGHSIDAKNLARIFKVSFFDVVLKNIRFVNANANLPDEKRYVDDSSFGPTCQYFIVRPEKNGGAIFTQSSLSILNSTFSNNTAVNGGAIFAYSQVYIENSSFSNNTAADDGGAIYSGDCISIAKANFTDNHAVDCGGAIYAIENVEANFSIFKNNHNTAVSAKQFTGTGNTFLQDEYMAMFSNATADYGIVTLNKNWDATGTVLINASNVVIDGKGYIIDAKGKSRLFNITGDNVTIKNIRFKGGSSIGSGGAIHVSSSRLTIIDSTFENCIAQMGGVIYGNLTEIIIRNSNFTNNGVYDFLENQMVLGGAVCTDNGTISVSKSRFINNSAYDGGALRADYGFITVENSYFENNSATVYGGGAFSSGIYANVTDSTFIGNHANMYGGAIFCYEEAKAYIRNSTFENNTSNHYGGAGSLAALVEVTDSIFRTNRATTAAGALSMWGNLTLVNSNFTENSAKIAGAVYDLSESSNVFIARSNFINNTQENDGALRIKNNAFVTDSNFINNHAYNGVCGAIVTYQNLTVSDSVFINNSAVRSKGNSVGGAIANYGENLHVDKCVFTNNSAHSGGAIANFAGNASVDNSQFISNCAVKGGACFNYVGFTLLISNSSFVSNHAEDGGACFNYYDSTFLVSDSIFENNSAEFGGAAYGTDAFNCTFIQNKALYHASAIYGVSNTADKCTFIRNIDYMEGMTVDVVTSGCTFADNRIIQRAYFTSIYTQSCYYQGEIIYMYLNSNADGSFLENATVTVRAYNNGVIVQKFEYLSGDFLPVNITEGNYTLQFSVEDHDYEVDPVNVTVTVIKKEIADVNISVENTIYPNPANIEFVSNLNGTVYIYIDGYYMDYFDVIANEKVQIAYCFSAGNHTVEVSITPANYHFDSKTFTQNFTVFKKQTFISVDVSNVSEYESVIVSVNASDNGMLRINVGDFEQIFYVSEGVGTQMYIAVFSPGTYLLTATFEEDDNYLSSNASKTFKVFKEVARQDISLSQNESGIVIGLPQDLTGSVIFSIAGENYTVCVVNGSGLVRIPSLDGNFYSYQMTYAGDEKYASFTIIDSLYIQYYQITPEMEVSEFKDGTSQVKLPEDATGTITLSINGEIYIFDVELGTADVKLPDLADGNYLYTITYSGNAKYASVETGGEVDVNNPQPLLIPDVSVPDLNDALKYGHVIVSVPDDVNGYVSLSILNKTYVFDVNGGFANVTLPDLENGVYEYSVTYYPQDKYASYTDVGLLTVNRSSDEKQVPEIVVPPLDEPSADGSIAIALPADATGKVTLTVNGNDYVFEVRDGSANVVLPDLENGNYTYSLSYSGDSKYSSFESVGVLNVNNTLPQALLIPNVSIPPLNDGLDNGYVIVRVPSDVEAKVALSISGNTYVFDVVDGKANVTLPDLADGDYDYSIEYYAQSKYANYIDIGILTVNRSSDEKPVPEIVIPPLDEPSNDGSVTVTLPGDATGTVTLTVNGKDYTYPVENGMAKVIIPDLDGGNYPYTITYSGDGKYSSFVNNGTLKGQYLKFDPVITASNLKVTYSAGSYYTIKINGTDGKPADGVKIVITVKGKTFKTLTVTNGIAKFKITSMPGTYKMNITALGKSITRTLTVKHLVTLKSVTVKKSAKKLVLTATLAKINKKYLKNKKITFKFNGKKYTAKTDKKGVAKVTIKSSVLKKLKVGKKLTYQATYSKDTVKKTAKVKK